MRSGLLLAVLCATRLAAADSHTLRMATEAPDGTAWARELRAFTRDVESATHGQVKLKWYWGGIAGDEAQIIPRIERGQLDGAGATAVLCERLAPSMRALRTIGVFRNWEESGWVRSRLSETFEKEFHDAGFVTLGLAGLGKVMLFSRVPVKSLADLRKLRIWGWNVDPFFTGMERSLGLNVVPTPLVEVGRALEEGRLDAFISVSTAVLAFQWYLQVKHVVDMPIGFLPGCIVVSNRVFARLPSAHQDAIRAAAAKTLVRFEDVGRETEARLLGGLLQKQGLVVAPPTEELRRDFFAAAREMRDKWDEVPRQVLQRALGLLADYRAERR
jgi:TRAP-type C4-dicarboxylate transport system substrate-binding protein